MVRTLLIPLLAARLGLATAQGWETWEDTTVTTVVTRTHTVCPCETTTTSLSSSYTSSTSKATTSVYTTTTSISTTASTTALTTPSTTPSTTPFTTPSTTPRTTPSTTPSTTASTTASTTTSSGAVATCTNYIVDSSFEQVDAATYDGATDFTSGSWSFAGTTATIQTNADFGEVVAYSGNQIGAFFPNGNAPAISISQPVSGLTVALPYQITFFYETPFFIDSGVSACTITTSFGGVALDVLTITAASPTVHSWTERSVLFEALATGGTLSFSAACTVTGDPTLAAFSVILDEVTVQLADGSCEIDTTPDPVNPENQ